jgi:NAD(P)-dependent dehydrogenase (short-subunit alcohol dehydrogenase family)
MQPGKGAVVITGASTGIGEACALHLDRLGFTVFAGVRRATDGAALQAQASVRLVPLMLDVTDEANITAAAQTVQTAVGAAGLAGLVNNAGIAVAGPLEYLPLAELRHQLEVNVIGQIAVTQAMLPLLRQGHGRVVNIGSISGKLASPLLGAYAASKFAMEALTDVLRMELRPWGLQVAIVEPGATLTPIWQKSLAAGDALAAAMPAEVQARYGKAMELTRSAARRNARAGTPPQQVADAVAHALTAARPKTRYPVGRDARIGSLLVRFLPDRTRDRLLGGRLQQS